MCVGSSVRPVQVCPELSIFIILAQIFKLTSCELQAVSQWSVPQSVSQQSVSQLAASQSAISQQSFS